MAREGRRFEFGWLEVLGLILTFALGSALCFFLGIFVGKGLQEGEVARDDQTVRLPLGAGGAGSAASAPAAALQAVAPHGGTPVPGASPAEARQASPAKAGDAGTTLAVRPPAPTATAVPGATPLSVATPTPALDAAAARTPSPTRTPAPPKPTPKPTRTPPPKPTKVPKATPTPQGRNGLANLKSGWSIQVNAAKDEATAAAVRARLQEKGFNAYVLRVNLQGETWYRVRVGRFPTMEAATAAVSRLKSDPSYARAFLVND